MRVAQFLTMGVLSMRPLRQFLALAAVLVAMTIGCSPSRPQNVILVVVDTLRADHLGLYGYERNTSPQLDEWATRGLVFEQALAPSPWTLPTFGSILTGLLPAQHSAGARFRSAEQWRRAPLSNDVETLPEILRQSGFATGAIVNNPFLREHFGASRGFDVYDYQKGRRADVVIDLAKQWVSTHREVPFFLMVHLIDPHLPYEAPESVTGRFGSSADSSVSTRVRKPIIEALPELTSIDRESIGIRYDEEIAFVDQEVGRLLQFLVEDGVWSDTLVILTSDHGEELFDHGGFEHGHSMFQELLRVPLVLWGPGVQGGREPMPVSLVDLAPTILAATGVATENELAGVSLWDATQKGRSSPRRELLAENTLWGRERQAIVAWPYKLILDPKSNQVQLFNLESDPRESRDIAREKVEVTLELERRLQDRQSMLDSGPAEDGVALSEEMEEELRALGYLD